MFVSDLTPVWPKLQFPQCLKLHISTPDLLLCEIHTVCARAHTLCLQPGGYQFLFKAVGEYSGHQFAQHTLSLQPMKKCCVPGGRRSTSVHRDKTKPRRDLTEQHDNTEAGNACNGIKGVFRNSSEAVFLPKGQV